MNEQILQRLGLYWLAKLELHWLAKLKLNCTAPKSTHFLALKFALHFIVLWLSIAYVFKVFATQLRLARLFNYEILILIVQNLYHKTVKN